MIERKSSTKARQTLLGGVAVSFMAISGFTHASPTVERLELAFPESVDSTESLMEAAPAVEKAEVHEYFILKGEKLREAMQRWTKTAGYELVWQPEPEEGDIRFAANMTFRSTFSGAAEEFFGIVRSQTKFDAQLHSNGVLRVFVATAKR